MSYHPARCPPGPSDSPSGARGFRRPGAPPRKTPVIRLVAFALGFRLVTAGLAFLANTVFPLDRPEQFTVLGQTHAFWDTFARYDSGWYWGIARDGYQYVEGGRSNLAFLPVYPAAMHAVGTVLGGRPRHFIQGGILVSWAMFALAMVMLFRLAREDLDEDAAWRAVMLAAVFPFAFFFGVVYPESTGFLALTVTAFYGFRTRKWWLAGLTGALSVCTRVNGILGDRADGVARVALGAIRSCRPLACRCRADAGGRRLRGVVRLRLRAEWLAIRMGGEHHALELHTGRRALVDSRRSGASAGERSLHVPDDGTRGAVTMCSTG